MFAKGMRAFGDGYVSILLPAYLLALGFGPFEVGALASAALFGSAALTAATGSLAHRAGMGALLVAAAVLMVLTGIGLASLSDYWPLLLVAAVGTVNPSGGDVSLFRPLEEASLADAAPATERTTLFSRYHLIGALAGAAGAQFSALPVLLGPALAAEPLPAMRAMFALYAVLGVAVLLLYRPMLRLAAAAPRPAGGLGPSRRNVVRLAALFSIDAFAGGFIVQSILALWLFQAFDLSLAAAATLFLCINALNALSLALAPAVARRFGLINTMVFTHLPSSMLLIGAALAPTLWLAVTFLLLRALLSQMDVPTRSAFVMAVVTPPERPAAASLTMVPRSLAAAASPAVAGYLLALTAFGWPLIVCGALKIAYDLALLASFRRVQLPDERTHE